MQGGMVIHIVKPYPILHSHKKHIALAAMHKMLQAHMNNMFHNNNDRNKV